MKLVSVFLLATALQLSATGRAQKVSISETNAPLVKVFASIEKQTPYVFFFDHALLEKARKLTINVRHQDVKDVLDECFRDQPLTYLIVKQTIVVKAKEPSVTIRTTVPVAEKQVPIPAPYRGKVVSDKNEPLAGATVLVKNSAKGTKTDLNGNFSIDADAGSTLVISFVGFTTQEVPVGADNTASLTITLQPNEVGGEEIVVIAYGTTRKSDLTGAVSQIKSKDLTAYPSTNIMQAMNGRSPGVRVIQNNGVPGGAVSVRIRGVNSILGGNEPLYVVDGFPFNGNPTFLQNADIESMEILKDASSIALYGSRGANGVVLITTKTGKKRDRSTVDLELGYSLQRVAKKMQLLTPKEYAELYNEQMLNDGQVPYFSPAVIDSLGGVKGTDWQDEILRTAPMYNTSITVNGGSEKTRFSLSGGVFLQDGIVTNTDFKRYSLRFSLQHDLSSYVNISTSTTITRITRALQNSERGNRGSDIFSAMLMAPPTLSPYLPDGSYRRMTTAYPFISNALINPLVNLNKISENVKADRIFSNSAVTFKPVRDLSIRISGGVENSNDRTDYYSAIEPSTNSVGTATISTSQTTSFLNENVVSYNKTIKGKSTHNIGATAGFTYQDYKGTSLNGNGTGFLSDATNTGNLGGAATPGIPSSGYGRWVLLSYLARLNYTLNDKYLATLSFRRDGSSRYSEANKWSNFPSAALAWRVSKEAFMQPVTAISDLKVRASYGSTGSTAINPYSTLNQLSSSNTTFGDQLYVAFAPGTTLPGDLKWETTDQLDVGLDAAFLNNRIRFTADYYVKTTRNLLNNVQLPASSGYNITVQNVGSIENRGFEFAVDADLIRNKELTWTASANISFNKNKVLKLYDGQDIYGGSIYTGALNDIVSILREGKAMGLFYGYQELGYTPTGNILYEDRNGDNAINAADKTFIGDPNPDFIYGVNSVLGYKGFEFTLFLQGSQGNDIFNLNQAGTLDLGMGLNQPDDVYSNHWTAAKTDAKYPRISRNLNGNMSSRFVEDGSYLRFKNIQLAYNIPVDRLNMTWMRNAQVYISGQNLITITKYSWYDPEVNAYGSANSFVQGVDYAIYPVSKSVTFGIRCGF
ncbi:MAG: SusC/RagA family TonB-linked outer membrane protein [Chitinophagaceae bacterium]|nr:MAG: SusC/RagA family TonB-linked outer membrane protein [Chitinophagaceae bacterium]